MKYIIIPLFRIVTLPLILIFCFGIMFIHFLSGVWDWDKNEMEELFDVGFILKFLYSGRYVRSRGSHGYKYDSIFEYIINKKTCGNEKAI